jgi:hypothetical protein
VKLFGEDYTQIDEFFSTFDQFLVSFGEARLDNEMAKKRKHDEEKRMLQANEQTVSSLSFLTLQYAI